MNVVELVTALNELLREHPEAADQEVQAEGCDCFGPVNSVDYDGKGVDLLRRSPLPTQSALGSGVKPLSAKPKETAKMWPPPEPQEPDKRS